LVINNNNAPPSLYLNQVKKSGNGVEIKLEGTESNRDAIGARVRLSIAGKTMTRQVEAGSGFASQVASTLHFGLGGATGIEGVEITWPSGLVQRFTAAQTEGWANSQVRITEGDSQAVAVTPKRASSRVTASRPKPNSPAM
jgi:ASPIC and UnbV